MLRLPSHVAPSLRALVLGAAVLFVGSSTAHASTITCGFGGQTDSCQLGPNAGLFNFGPFSLELSFNNVHGPFNVSVTDALTSQNALGNRLNNFPGYSCVPLDGTNCVDFQVSAPAPSGNTWTGFYDLSIFWLTNTNSTFPNGPDNRIRILHNRGDVPGDGFDTDITIIGSYIAGGQCEDEDHDHHHRHANDCDDDPGISGRDDNFQSFLVVQAPAVPEPGTLVLIGSGVAGWVVRRRRISR
ncbi:MAG TPA: PEP-CTERM sorting domain-containing protein [Vicinamibacterales bacterium]|nr:PEP-CTERM sorting domain-containing protein [Vicinamibacterales bacterium]